MRTSDARLVGHLEAVRHVRSKRHIENRRLHAAILHNVNHFGHEHARVPRKGAARLQNDLNAPFLPECLDYSDQLLDVVALARHQVAAAHVHPLHLRNPASEFRLEGIERILQIVGIALAQGVEVQPFDVARQLVGQLRRQNSEARAGLARIVKVSVNAAVLRIHPQAHRHLVIGLASHCAETLVLPERVERYVAAALENGREIALGVGRRIGVSSAAKLAIGQERLVHRAGRRHAKQLADNGERSPQGERLEC